MLRIVWQLAALTCLRGAYVPSSISRPTRHGARLPCLCGGSRVVHMQWGAPLDDRKAQLERRGGAAAWAELREELAAHAGQPLSAANEPLPTDFLREVSEWLSREGVPRGGVAEAVAGLRAYGVATRQMLRQVADSRAEFREELSAAGVPRAACNLLFGMYCAAAPPPLAKEPSDVAPSLTPAGLAIVPVADGVVLVQTNSKGAPTSSLASPSTSELARHLSDAMALVEQQLHQAHRAAAREAERRGDELRVELRAVAAELREASAALAAQSDEIAALKDQLEFAQARITDHDELMEAAEARAAEQASRLIAAVELLAGAEEQLGELQATQHRELRRIEAANEQEVQQLVDELRAAEEDLHAQEEQLAATRARAEAAARERAAVEEQMASLCSRLKERMTTAELFAERAVQQADEAIMGSV